MTQAKRRKAPDTYDAIDATDGLDRSRPFVQPRPTSVTSAWLAYV
jgi:hypothetical protein